MEEKENLNIAEGGIAENKTAQVEGLLSRLAGVRPAGRSDSYGWTYTMLCPSDRMSVADRKMPEYAVPSVFGKSYYSHNDSSGPESGWEVWLVDEKMKPVNDRCAIYRWRRSLPSSGFDWEAEGYDDSKPYVRADQKVLDWLSGRHDAIDGQGRPLVFAGKDVCVSFGENGGRISGALRFGVDDDGALQWITGQYAMGSRSVGVMPVDRETADFASELISDFSLDIADEVLSLLLSAFPDDSLKIEWEGKRVRKSDRPVQPSDTVVMESVDEEMGLNMSVVGVVGAFPVALCRDFDIARSVSVRDDEIIVRKVARRDPEALAATLAERIERCAPTRKMARGLRREGAQLYVPRELAEVFLYRELPWLLDNFSLVGSEKLRAYKLRAALPKVCCRLSSGIDFLEGELSVEIGEERFTLADLLEQYRRKKYVTLSDGDRVILHEDYIRRLQRIFRTGRGKNRNDVEVSMFDVDELEELLGRQLDDDAVKRRREVYEGLTRINSMKLRVPGLNGRLRPYQRSGVKWLKYLYDNNLGGCLADDMGLGKTIQTIALLSLIYPGAAKPSLIVMPRSLIFNWQEELARFAPQLRTAVYYGAGRNMDEAMQAQIVLTTYAMVRNDIAELKDRDFELIVLDESQNIKNQSAQITRAVWLLRGTHRLAISGTPIENNLDELYSLFRFLSPAMFGSAESFRNNYTLPIQRDEDKAAADSLRRKIFPFILRRLKKDVLTDLPDRVDQTLYVEMNEEQARYYERRRREYKEMVDASVSKAGIGGAQMVLLQALGELRRIASVPEAMTDGRVKSAKLQSLFDSLEQAVENGHKTVVFFNFIAGLELVSGFLEEKGIAHETMTGATADRRNVVDRFQNDSDCRILLMTLKTGGVGLNLTAADTVYIFEPWWNKAAEEQGVNRLHRIGQQSKVHCYSMITKGTIEEKIRQLQEKKALLVDEIITADSGGLKHLTAEDIEFIFK